MRFEVPQADAAEASREGAAGDSSSNNLTAFQRRNTRLPTNFIADRAAEGGGEEFQRLGRFEAPLQPPPLSGGVSNVVKTIPGRRATFRSAGRCSRVIS